MKDIEALLRTHRERNEPDADEAVRRFSSAAADARLLDVAYTEVDSPVGSLVIAATRRGLARISYSNEDEARVLEELAAKLSPRVLRAPARLDDVRRELDEYFEGVRTRFDLPIDWSLTQGFSRKVLRATARIPYGKVSTYKKVAGRAGNERAARAAGNALRSNPIPIVVPCHRVLGSGGALTGYAGGLSRKEFLLGLEGVL